MKFLDFKNIPTRTKLILLFSIVSIIPTLIIGILSLNIASRTTLEKEVNESVARLGLIDYRVNEIIKDKHKNAVKLAYNDNVRRYCENVDNKSDDELLLLEGSVKRKLMNFYDSQLLSSIILVKNDGEALYYSSEEYSLVQKINAPEQIPEDLDKFVIFDLWAEAAWDDKISVIPYKRIILGKESNEPVAYLILNVREDTFNSLYVDYELSKGTECFIVNSSGNIQTCTDKKNFSLNISNVFGFGVDRFENSQGFFKTDTPDGECVITYTYNEQHGLYFIEKIPIANINAGFRHILILTIVIAALCILAGIILGIFLSRSFTRPLHRLIDRVSKYESKGYNETTKSKNEFVILNKKYEEIINHLEQIIHEYYEEQKKKKEAEIRALEFQINPHFLYNTLSTIIWLIERDQGRKAIKITKDLSSFFRISISKGKKVISIREELKHVELYVNIQKARYEDTIDFYCDVPEELDHYLIPKLILQPLVENSIIHAMQKTDDKKVIIQIYGYMQNGDIVLEVIDNGKIDDESVIEEMNSFLEDRESNLKEYGVGISNVHDRVRMHYGKEYGLHYKRENGETIASVRLRTTTRRK